jgi:uncharacterized protein YhdP
MRLTRWALLSVTATVALASGLGVLLVWNHDGVRQAAVGAVSAQLQLGVAVGRLDLGFERGHLVLVLSDVRIGAAGSDPVGADGLRAARLLASIDLARSLRERVLHLRGVSLDGLQLRVERDAEGRLAVVGLPRGDGGGGWTLQGERLLTAGVSIRDAVIGVRDLVSATEREILVERAVLEVAGGQARLRAEVRLPELWGGRLRAGLVWSVDGATGLRPALEQAGMDWTLEVDRLAPTFLPDMLALAGVRLPPAGGRHRVGDPTAAPLPTAAIDRLTARGTLHGSPLRVGFEVDGSDLQLDVQRWLRGRVPVDAVTAHGFYALEETGWRLVIDKLVAANEDANGRGRLELSATGGGRPYLALDVSAEGQAGNGGRFGRYLPDAYLAPGVVGWLDRGVGGGSVREAKLRLRGEPGRFDLDAADALLISARFDGVGLDVRPGWQPLTEVAGQLVVDGAQLSITEASGRTANAQLVGVSATIADLRRPELHVGGEFFGSGQSLLRYVAAMPLVSAPVRELLGEFDFGGEHQGRLELVIPFRGRPISVSGRVDVQAGTLAWPRRGLEVRRIDGRVGFSESGISADGVQVDLDGAEGLLRVSHTPAGPDSRTLLEVAFEDFAASTVRRLVPGLEFLHGAAAARISLDLPGFRSAGPERDPVALRLVSDLIGIDVRLPAPLSKRPATSWPLRLEMALGSVPGPLRVSVGDTLDGLFTWDESGQLLGADIGFGRPVQFPARAGMTVRGAVDRLDLSRWLARADTGSGAGMPPLRELVLRVGSLRLGDLDLGEVAINASGGNGQVDARLNGSRIDGLVSWSADDDEQASAGPQRGGLVSLALSRLTLSPGVRSEQADASEPSRGWGGGRLPALSARIAQFELDDLELGRLWLESSYAEDGRYHTELRLDRPHVRFEASSDWTDDEAGGSNRLSFSLHSADVGLALARAGHPHWVRGGWLELAGALTWAGAPQALTLQALGGQLTLEVADARLQTVEPGVARMLGLVSVSNLRRRLALDFSDVVGRGTQLDRLSAVFSLDRGVALLEQGRMESATARVDAGGVVDLGARTLDGWLTVMPKASAAMPLLGGILAGPPGAAALFVIEQLMSEQVDRATRMHYQVSGAWADPDWRRRSRLAALLTGPSGDAAVALPPAVRVR